MNFLKYQNLQFVENLHRRFLVLRLYLWILYRLELLQELLLEFLLDWLWEVYKFVVHYY
jgi:hypothetical protein